ncbi:hypothetical protein CDAR_450252 [Caerostris darwini]|uniref:Wntless GOLD domain-containing protein n=1 Tax=Caerostris darwini TaxID=1538125 RepID=A0AAV4W467_9ARAC|nr:hypothetical protein CDAR_450252 [Caerostris darwini]
MLFEIRAVMVVFSAFIGSIIVITVGWYNISLLDNDSRGMDVSLEALTCVVKKNFRVFFDDVWLSPNGKNSKNGIDIGCVTPDTNREIVMQNGSDLTMDEIVYAFELPPAINGTSEGFADWTDVAEGHLLLDIVFKKDIPKEVIPQLTFEVKLGFKDSDNPHANWTLHTQSMETRKLYCNTSASSLYENYKYGCNFLPFFKLLDIKHRHYLINLYFPIEIFPLHINSDINFIRTIKMVFIQYPTSYNKYIFFMRMILYPLSVGLSIWFIRRIGYKPIFLIESTFGIP